MTAFQPEPLTCETALERLDAVWLDPLPDEPLDADVLAAREHLQECSACWAKWEERRAADRRIAELMQAIPVPSGLKAQLLAQSAAVDEPPSDNSASLAPDATSPTRRLDRQTLHRRAWWISVAAMLLVSAAGGSWLWWSQQPRPVSMQLLTDGTPLTSTGLERVQDNRKLPPVPATWTPGNGFKAPEVRWYSPPDSRSKGGWVNFTLTTRGGLVVRGVLLAMNRDSVLDPPSALVTRPSWLKYTQRDGKPLSVAGWTEGNVVYLCFVSGEPKAMELVLKVTTPTPV